MADSASAHGCMTAAGTDPVSGTPEEFAAYIKAEVPKWAQVVKASGARAD